MLRIKNPAQLLLIFHLKILACQLCLKESIGIHIYNIR